MKVTSIEVQRKNERRCSVFIDDVFVFGLSDVDVLFYKLKAGEEISQEKYNTILQNVIYTKAKDKAIVYLSYKGRTRNEIVKKLLTEDYTETVVEEVLGMLEKYGYIDDFSYSKSFIRNSVNLKSNGKRKIFYDLKERGVPEAIINKAFDEIELDESKSILKLINKKIKDKNNVDEKLKKRTYDFLIRKGFSYNDINEGMKLFLENK